MPKEYMTPKERWLAVLNRQKPDRVPMDYWATPEASARLIKHLGLSSKSEQELVKDFAQPIFDNRMHPTAGYAALRQALKQLHVDFVISVSPRYVGPLIPDDEDVFGCQYRTINYGTGEYKEITFSPLAGYNSVEEIEASFHWPDPDW